MPLTLVSHSPCPAALYGALAASVAQAEGALLMHLPAEFGPEHGADSVQMVAADGALVPSGLLWYERLTGHRILPASTVEAIVEAAQRGAVVVPWHAAYQPKALLQTLVAQAQAAGLAVRHLAGQQQHDGWAVHGEGGTPIAAHGLWRRDRFGRWSKAEPATPARRSVKALHIALLGTEADHTDVNPATFAALGDVADAAAIDLHIRCVAPTQFDVSQLQAADGIVLPGGSDMANVPGQIRAAHHGLASGIPTLGLCLGMQSMTTALAQTLTGLEQANMAEAAPDAPIKSFVPMAGTPGLAAHRLGEQCLQVEASATGQAFEHQPTVRCNHRFRLNPELIEPLLAAGMVITARDASGQITDAIDWPSHTFYQGMQGHPELSSTVGQPHPLIAAFMHAALKNSEHRAAPAPGTHSLPASHY